MRFNNNDPSLNQESSLKKRKPGLSAFFSFLSLGLGQVYNGELFKGLLLKFILLFSLSLFVLLSYKSPEDLLLLSALSSLFILLKLYSMVQAYIKSRQWGSSYRLKVYNKSHIYIFLTAVFLALNIFIPLIISRSALMEKTDHHPFRSAKAKERYLELYDRVAEEWPVDSTTRMVDTAHGQTFVRASGPDEAPPLVLLPGANATSLMWIPNIEALSESYRVFAVDNIYDFGRSVFTRPFKTPDDFVRWLDGLFNALGLKDGINLMGLSYGGWLTSQYALRFPDRLDKIVLVAPAATVLNLNSEFALHALVGLIPHRCFVKKTMFWALEDFMRSSEITQEMKEFFVENMYLGLRCFKLKMLVSPTVLTDLELKSLEMPTLILVGENEKIYSAQDALDRLNRVAPHIKTELIPDAGHDLTVVQAEEVNRKVLEFLNSRKDTSPLP